MLLAGLFLLSLVSTPLGAVLSATSQSRSLIGGSAQAASATASPLDPDMEARVLNRISRVEASDREPKSIERLIAEFQRPESLTPGLFYQVLSTNLWRIPSDARAWFYTVVLLSTPTGQDCNQVQVGIFTRDFKDGSVLANRCGVENKGPWKLTRSWVEERHLGQPPPRVLDKLGSRITVEQVETCQEILNQAEINRPRPKGTWWRLDTKKMDPPMTLASGRPTDFVTAGVLSDAVDGLVKVAIVTKAPGRLPHIPGADFSIMSNTMNKKPFFLTRAVAVEDGLYENSKWQWGGFPDMTVEMADRCLQRLLQEEQKRRESNFRQLESNGVAKYFRG